MNNADTIKEFLVGLGFKVDERSFKNFNGVIGTTTREVTKLGAITVATAATIEAFAAKVAASFDRLYFASKRTGATAEEINAFGFAISQMGGTADDAKASLENLARFMRTQPGAGGLLTRVLGVAPEHLKDTAKIMNDLAATFKRMPLYLGERYASMLGIDEKTFLAMRDTGTMTGKEDQYREMLRRSGVDLEDITQKSHEFNNQLKTLDTNFGLLAAEIESDLLPFMRQLNDLILSVTSGHGKGKTKAFFNFVGAHSYVPDLIDWIGANSPLGGAVEGVQEFGAGIAKGMWQTRGLANNNPGNLRRWGNAPIKGGFAAFPTAYDGLAAMAKQLSLYGARGTDTIAGIVSRWAPSADGNNVAAYIKDMMGQTGFGAAQHLNMSDPETLAKLMNGITMHENGRNPYSTALVSAAARSGVNAQVSQSTTINVTGGDPQRTASAVAAEQGRVNQQMVRNVVGAVQ